MKVNLNIEEDEQFRKYVKELIGGQVRAILREQLADIVAGEIGKLRLLQPDSPALNQMVDNRVQAQIRDQVSRIDIRGQVRNEVSGHVREAVAPIAAQIKQVIADEVVKVIKA